MWKYFIYTCLLVLFTGCGTKEISYNKTFIDYNLNSKTKKNR